VDGFPDPLRAQTEDAEGRDTDMANATNSAVPSFECEAAEEAARFIAQQNPQLAREFVQHMRKRGDERKAEHRVRSAGGRIRQGYMHWASWMEDVLSSPVQPTLKVVFTDPIEAAIFGQRTAEVPSEEDAPFDANFMKDLERQQQEEKAKRDERQRFLYYITNEATSKLSLFDPKKGLSELVSQPEILEFEGAKVIFVYSYTTLRYGKKVRHDYRANGIPVTTKHPDMIMCEDGQRLIRSFENGNALFYVKALEYHDGMYFRGYFNVEGNQSDEERLTKYYQIINGEVTAISALEYQRLENMRAAGLDPADPKWASQQTV